MNGYKPFEENRFKVRWDRLTLYILTIVVLSMIFIFGPLMIQEAFKGLGEFLNQPLPTNQPYQPTN